MLGAEAVLWLWSLLRSASLRVAFAASPAVLILMMVVSNYRSMDQSGNRLAEVYGRLILDSAEKGLLFTQDDNTSFTTMYLRYAENYQPDVEVFDQSSRLAELRRRASDLSGRPVQDYKTARQILLDKAEGARALAKCHFPYSADWYSADQRLYSLGMIYSLTPPVRIAPPIPTPDAAAKMDFKSRQILINLAFCRAESFLRQSQPDSARATADFRRAFDFLEEEPRAALWNQLGIAYRHFAQEDLALAAYERALKAPRMNAKERGEIVFNVSNIYKDRGNRLSATGEFARAAQAFENALNYDPDNPKLLYNVGVIYVHYLQNPQKGAPYLQRYLATNPGDEKVRKLLETYQTQK
jgi:tetratricopeptide (TPR) repeat protein